MKWWSKNPSVSKSIVQSLMKEIGQDVIDGTELPKSVKGLLAAEEPFLDTIPLIEGESNGIKYWYRDPIALLAKIVDYYYEELAWEYDFNNGKIEHWLNSKAAKRYSHLSFLLSKLHHNTNGIKAELWKMLLPILFEDDYTVGTKRIKKQGGVYLTLANFLRRFFKRDRMFLVCILPEGIDKLSVLLEIIVKPFQNLERGIVVKNLSRRPGCHYFLGSLFAVLGDHLGLSFLECITTPTSLTPCRFCLLLKWSIPHMHKGPLRDPCVYPVLEHCVNYLTSGLHGYKGQCREVLAQQGNDLKNDFYTVNVM